MKALCIALFVALAAPVWGSAPTSDVEGLWTADFFGNTVECHLEQKGEYLWGVAYVTTRAGERNTYHLVGVVSGDQVVAMHGSSGNRFSGQFTADGKATGTFFMKDGPSMAMEARRVKGGHTHPGGLQWPPNYPPAK